MHWNLYWLHSFFHQIFFHSGSLFENPFQELIGYRFDIETVPSAKAVGRCSNEVFSLRVMARHCWTTQILLEWDHTETRTKLIEVNDFSAKCHPQRLVGKRFFPNYFSRNLGSNSQIFAIFVLFRKGFADFFQRFLDRTFGLCLVSVFANLWTASVLSFAHFVESTSVSKNPTQSQSQLDIGLVPGNLRSLCHVGFGPLTSMSACCHHHPWTYHRSFGTWIDSSIV